MRSSDLLYGSIERISGIEHVDLEKRSGSIDLECDDKSFEFFVWQWMILHDVSKLELELLPVNNKEIGVRYKIVRRRKE